jgi:hypothetical protein
MLFNAVNGNGNLRITIFAPFNLTHLAGVPVWASCIRVRLSGAGQSKYEQSRERSRSAPGDWGGSTRRFAEYAEGHSLIVQRVSPRTRWQLWGLFERCCSG